MGDGTDSRLKKLYTGVYEFLTEKWVATHEEAKAPWLHRFAHYWVLVFKSFSRNHCPLRATALAYTTLLALIPMLAIGFGIASSVLKEKDVAATKSLIGDLVDAVVPQLKLLSQSAEKAGQEVEPPNTSASAENAAKPSARDQVITQIFQLINNAQSTTLGLTGMAGLIVVAILLVSTIEDTFNDSWGVTSGRTWFRRIVQYWTTI